MLDAAWYRPLKTYTAVVFGKDHLSNKLKFAKFSLSWIFLIATWVFIMATLFDMERMFYGRIITMQNTTINSLNTSSTNVTVIDKTRTTFMDEIWKKNQTLQGRSL